MTLTNSVFLSTGKSHTIQISLSHSHHPFSPCARFLKCNTMLSHFGPAQLQLLQLRTFRFILVILWDPMTVGTKNPKVQVNDSWSTVSTSAGPASIAGDLHSMAGDLDQPMPPHATGPAEAQGKDLWASYKSPSPVPQRPHTHSGPTWETRVVQRSNPNSKCQPSILAPRQEVQVWVKGETTEETIHRIETSMIPYSEQMAKAIITTSANADLIAGRIRMLMGCKNAQSRIC